MLVNIITCPQTSTVALYVILTH